MQFSKTLTAVTQELRKTVLLKVNEIESWRADLQSKNEEINRKDLKIKILEERCKILNGQNEWWNKSTTKLQKFLAESFIPF